MKLALIAKAIILNSSDEVLIAQRSATKKYNRNGWTTPAGHIEAGETPDVANKQTNLYTLFSLPNDFNRWSIATRRITNS